METIRVQMSEIAVAKAPSILETLALGSCMGVVLYDPKAKIGGLSHAMLPDSNFAAKGSMGKLEKFVNSSIDMLLEKMIRIGARRGNIIAKLTGGANMFPDVKTANKPIGERNIESAKEKLLDLDIPIISEDIGGPIGRTILFDTATGKLTVKNIKGGEKII